MSIRLCIAAFVTGYALVLIGIGFAFPMGTTLGVFLVIASIIAGILRTGLLPDIGIDKSPLPPGHECPFCGYDLRGVAQRVCPECGTAFTVREANAHLLEAAAADPPVHSPAKSPVPPSAQTPDAPQRCATPIDRR